MMVRRDGLARGEFTNNFVPLDGTFQPFPANVKSLEGAVFLEIAMAVAVDVVSTLAQVVPRGDGIVVEHVGVAVDGNLNAVADEYERAAGILEWINFDVVGE